MPTKGKVLIDDMNIKAIPFYNVSNTSGGNTVFIGSGKINIWIKTEVFGEFPRAPGTSGVNGDSGNAKRTGNINCIELGIDDHFQWHRSSERVSSLMRCMDITDGQMIYLRLMKHLFAVCQVILHQL